MYNYLVNQEETTLCFGTLSKLVHYFKTLHHLRQRHSRFLSCENNTRISNWMYNCYTEGDSMHGVNIHICYYAF